MSATAKVGKKLAVSVLFDTVSVEIICGDEYEAQVLFDDIVERMQSGEGISLGVEPKEATP
jgi:hypothetical protein